MSVIEYIVIIGAGNGGKVAATDPISQEKKVNLFEFAEYKENLMDLLIENATLTYGCCSKSIRSKFL